MSIAETVTHNQAGTAEKAEISLSTTPANKKKKVELTDFKPESLGIGIAYDKIRWPIYSLNTLLLKRNPSFLPSNSLQLKDLAVGMPMKLSQSPKL